MNVEEARHRLEVLYADMAGPFLPPIRSIATPEREALRVLLDELHRLHVAVSTQRKVLENINAARKKRATKPAGARTRLPSTNRTSHNGGHEK